MTLDDVEKPDVGQDTVAAGGAKAVTGSILDGVDDGGGAASAAGANGKATAAPANGKAGSGVEFPEDWRERIAAGDEKYLGELKRYASPDAFGKSVRELRKKLSERAPAAAKLPEKPTPEELTAYREANGIPAEPAGYEPPEIDGYEWDDADRAVLDEFFIYAHERDLPQASVNASLEWYIDRLKAGKESTHTRDAEFRKSTEDELRSEYAADYRGNMTLYKRIITDPEVFKDDFHEQLLGARLPDGTRVANHPQFARFMIESARSRYGDGGMIAPDTSAKMTSRADEIRKIMKTDMTRYWAEGLDKELNEIEMKTGKGKQMDRS